jgi:hydrogenase maturation protease
MNPPRILIAGIGNIFLGDDAFGVEVAQRLVRRKLPDGVRVVDFGIRDFDLAYAILDGPDLTILVDAIPRGGEPGTLYVIEPELAELNALDPQAFEPHSMNPLKVLYLIKRLGGQPGRLLIVGCEPAELESEDGQMGLSEHVQAAVDEAINLIESLVEKTLAEGREAEHV